MLPATQSNQIKQFILQIRYIWYTLDIYVHIQITVLCGEQAERRCLPCYLPYSYIQYRPYVCFLLMTLVPVQKLCVNIYVYIYVYIPYTSSVIGLIYNGSVIQYWRSCTPSRSKGECAVPDLNAILCFLWFTNCVLLFDNNLILGCLWHCVFV